MKVRCKLFSISLTALAIAALALSGCEKKEERGVSRLPGMEATSTANNSGASAMHAAPDSGAIPKHAAPPLDQMGNMVNPHANDASTSGSNPPMMVRAGQTEVMAGGNILQVAGLAFNVSEDWTNVKPNNPVRVAEYKLEGSGGTADMAVYYFGKGQGGGIEANIRRWAGQFADAKTTSPGAQVARLEKGPLKVALVKTEGTYSPGSMGPMMPAAAPQENYALFGLVVEGGPEGSVFIKVTGPKATMAEQDKALEKMAQSVRVSDYQ